MTDITHILQFLYCPTPAEWVGEAAKPANLPTLLPDHANCEHAAAQTAMTMMKRYRAGIPGISNSKKKAADTAQKRLHGYLEYDELLHMLSRLAREELRHFEQVIAIMKKRGICYPQLPASRYAGELRGCVRNNEPGRLMDTLLCGAVIEARSCERFAALLPVLDDDLSAFYGSLLKSESRHFMDYLKLARKLGSPDEVEQRLEVLLLKEQELICSSDPEFRFHSGVPLID
jgi:tRNA-(ms[2]io[6]A)-hydroxylase